MKHKAIAAWQIILIIFIILVVLFGLYLGLAWILKLANGGVTNPSTSSSPSSNQSATKPSGNFDQRLVGTWQTDCWVPRIDNKLAHQAKVTISKDGIADYTGYEYYYNDCTTLQPANIVTTKFKLEIPLQGQINMTFLENKSSAYDDMYNPQNAVGTTIYDIYQVTATDLKIAFGFRPATGGDGTTEAKRQTSIEGTMNYKKQ